MGILRLIKEKFDIINRQKEDAFYERLFVKNEHWNSSFPNSEETLRWRIIEQFILKIIERKVISEIKILDLGCGRGWLSKLLSRYGDVLGIEPVKGVVAHARFMFPEIKFICGTTKTLLRAKNFKKFNLIVASEVIEHIPDAKKEFFLRDISLLLKEEGYLIITTPRKEAQAIWNSYMKPDQPVEDWMSENNVENLAIKMNFEKVDLNRFSIPPVKDAPEIEIYQLWLFQKIK